MLSKFVGDADWTRDLDKVWKKAVTSRICRWSLGVLVSSYLLYRFFVGSRQNNFAAKIAAKQKARIINRKNLESVLRVDGQLMTAERTAIVSLDLPELQSKLRSGELSCVQVLQAFQARALEVNEKTNAVVEFLEDALARAKYLDSLPDDKRGPLHGIPISLKEHIQIKGLDSTVGIPSNLGKLAEADAGIVSVMKHLGAVPFCRTNLPQTNCSYECSNPIFGATLNPRDLTRGPGGSSGGEAALIAAGGSVMGFGSDLGGSVRIPAMYCGITSLKPTAGRIPITGQGSDGGLVGVVGLHNTIGFMARSSKSIEECLKAVVNDPTIEDLTADARLVSIPWRDLIAKPGKKLKIGWYTYDGSMLATPGCRRAVHEAVRILQENGHEVVLFCPTGLDKVNMMYGRLGFVEYDRSTKEMLESGCEIDQQSLSLLKLCWKVPLCLKSAVASVVGWYFNSQFLAEGVRIPIYAKQSWQLMELKAKRLEVVEALLADWRGHNIDVVIAPGFAMPAVKLGYAGWLLGAITYTSAYNMLNFPVGSVPISSETSEDQDDMSLGYPGAETDIVYEWLREGVQGSEGMPLNVQVIGLPWKEEVVLRVMHELQEKANPDLKLDL